MFQRHELAFLFGILGNIVSFLVFLAPLPTFYRIIRKKTTYGFQSIPYSVALFSAMLMLYYAFLKPDGFFLITINSIGIVIESFYLIIFLFYAPKKSKIYTIKLLVLYNTGIYGVIVACTYIFSHGDRRIAIVGWICAVFSVSVFAAPLSIIRLVIRTKSVEFMSISLSFFLTLCAVIWFFYGFLIQDYYVATPNILGFAFGIAQMILYLIYKDAKKEIMQELKLKDLEGGDSKKSGCDATIEIYKGKKEANVKDKLGSPNNQVVDIYIVSNSRSENNTQCI